MRKQRERWMMTYKKTKNNPPPLKDLEKWLKTETTNIRKERWRNGSNNMKGRKIAHEYNGDTKGMTIREQVVISRLRTGYTRATHGTQCLFCDTGLTEDTKIPVANTIEKNNPIPNQNYHKVHFLNPNSTRN
jgi:hypothetical protein